MRRPSEKAPVGGYPSFRKYTARNGLVDKNLTFWGVGCLGGRPEAPLGELKNEGALGPLWNGNGSHVNELAGVS
ncbi:protein of unknown function [Nitrospira defluvii]|jgi:hypothetical protein|uniref:Uncharacterized protein n=1 Tax=Nitrospira defluvii TaxID=330214 RepID=D8P9Y1_9BACT|nr:protein of unknown function [Nitrospira defluvii]